MRNCIFVTTLALLLFPSFVIAKDGFYDQRYRGWLWFEEEQMLTTKKDHSQQSNVRPTKEEMQQAKTENEEFEQELLLRRHMMIRYPKNIEYVRFYKEKENEMLDAMNTLGKSFAMAIFLYPELADQLKSPQNMYGRGAKRDYKQQIDNARVANLVDKIELFVFRQDNCVHTPILEKHLNGFALKYGFKVEAVTQDNSQSMYFKTYNNKDLVDKLAQGIMPTVIAVTKDSSLRFELARGAVSIADLEEKAALMSMYYRTSSE